MRYIPLKSLATLGLLLASLVAAGSAGAQIPVTDGAHIGINNFAWIEQQRQMVADELNQIRQIEHQVSQIQNQLQDLREQQVIGQKLELDLGPRETNLQRREVTRFLAERCGSLAAGGGGIGGLMNMGVSDRVKEARERQHAACTALVQEENKRHNFIVETLESIQERDRQIMRLRAESANIKADERGKLQNNTNAISQLMVAQEQEVENARRVLQYYEQQISGLKDEMAWAGQYAFSNKRSLLGHAVQYGTLRLALQAARQRDR
jgi:conjugal transfer/entry exclusion protein